MRVEDLIDAIGAIDPVWVEEAENWKRAETRHISFRTMREKVRAGRKVLLPLAACLCLIVAGSAYGLFRSADYFSKDKGMSGGAAGSAADAGADGGMEESADSAADAGLPEAAAGGAAGQDAGEGMNAGASDPKEADGSPEAAAGGAADAGAPVQETDAASEAGAEETGEAVGTSEWGKETIAINEVEELCSTNIDMETPASVEYWLPEELAGYYGTDVLPEELPEGYGLVRIPAEGYVVGYDKDGRLLDDHILLEYEGEDGGAFTVSVRTTETGAITSFAADDLAVSGICGNEVTIGHYMEGTGETLTDGYLAVFEKKNVIFTVQSHGMGEEQFLAVLRGLQD